MTNTFQTPDEKLISLSVTISKKKT